MTPFLAIWAALALAVLILLAWRQMIDLHEDDSIHISDTKATQEQSALARKMAAVDRWGRLLIIFTVVYGVGLGGVYLYRGWLESTRLPM